MTLHEFPRLGERYWEQRLENGLLLRVVPKPGFARSYAFLGVDYGSVDTSFTRGGIPCRTPDGVAHYLEHKMFDLPEGNAMNLFAAHGGYPNAFTGYAMTAYYFDCTEQFAENLRILLRMVLTPWFPAESVEKERGIIAQLRSRPAPCGSDSTPSPHPSGRRSGYRPRRRGWPYVRSVPLSASRRSRQRPGCRACAQ